MATHADLFVFAAMQQYRFPTGKGMVAAESLFQMPLTSKSGTSLNDTAIELDRQIKAKGEQSFVETKSDPELNHLRNKLEIVKFVINQKQAENAAALDAKKKADHKQRLLEALAEKEDESLKSLSVEELRAELAKL